MLDWIRKMESLTAAALTLLAQQAVPPDDLGELWWSLFFPRVDATSIVISEITDVDFRPTAAHRGWNAPGKKLGIVTPTAKEMTMVPIESYFTLSEYEMQILGRPSGGNRELFKEIIGARILDRVPVLADAAYRSVEIAMWHVWLKGELEAADVEGNKHVVSLGYNADRYRTAGTAWDDGGEDAYANLVAFAEAATDFLGAIPVGIVTRKNVMKAIQADAPRPAEAPNVQLTPTQLTQRLSDDILNGTGRFTIQVIEDGFDPHNSPATDDYTRTKSFDAGYIAAIPPSQQIGVTHFAEVLRADDIDTNITLEGTDERGVSIYHFADNSGKTLRVEGQLNALSVPAERNVFVENTLIT